MLWLTCIHTMKDITYYNWLIHHPPIAQLVERRTVVELLISLGRWFKSGSVDGNIFFIHNHYISPWQHITMATHHIVTSVYPKDITYYNSSFKHPLIAQLVERRTVVELLISLGRWFKSGSVDGNFFSFLHLIKIQSGIISEVYKRCILNGNFVVCNFATNANFQSCQNISCWNNCWTSDFCIVQAKVHTVSQNVRMHKNTLLRSQMF